VPAVETLEVSLRREPDVGSSPSSHQGEGLMHAVETLEMMSGQGPCVGGSLGSQFFIEKKT